MKKPANPAGFLLGCAQLGRIQLDCAQLCLVGLGSVGQAALLGGQARAISQQQGAESRPGAAGAV